MNNENSPYDIFGQPQPSQDSGMTNENQNQESTYEYVFSHGLPPVEPKKSERKSNRFWLGCFAVLMCAFLSFSCGMLGALYAQTQMAETGNPYYSAPAQGQLHANADEHLSKAEGVGSPYGSAGENVFAYSQVAREVADSVVVIDAQVPSGSFGYLRESAGSGVVISENGYILTSNHVVENAKKITVTLNSGSIYEAALVGSDHTSDLAVLLIEPRENLTAAKQGSSADLVLGEQVIAVGNPLGILGGTVTNGIISSTERTIVMSDGTQMTLLQTNAAINSGNSGGGLFNLAGQLIGIVNAKYAAEGVEGLAFAIPIDSAYAVECDLIEHGYVRGVIDHGLELLDITDSNLIGYRWCGIDTVGVYVVSSEYTAELQNKDRIISIDSKAVTTASDVQRVLSQHKVGDSITVVASRDGKEITVTMTLREYIPDSMKNKTN